MSIHVMKCERQVIRGLTSDQISAIKDRLTFDNPAYKSAVRYSKRRYISIPKYLTFYNEFKGISDEQCLVVPIGFNVSECVGSSTSIEVTDQRVSRTVPYPDFKLELRNDQFKAETAYIGELSKKDYPKCLIQLPTGKGKSILALHIAYRLAQKTLVLVHKDDLVTGWKKDINLCFGNEVSVGLIKAKSRTVGKHITIATVQTLAKMSERELDDYVSQFGLVIQDECHHIGLKIFNVLDKFNSKYKLGLSATPTRSDGLDFVFDLFLGGIGYRHIITEDDEDISSVEVEVIESPFRYSPFIYQGEVFNYYDYKPQDLPDTVELVENMDYATRPNIPYLTADNSAVRSLKTKIMVCKKIIAHYRQGHSVIALFTQKEHINLYRDYLKRFIPSDQILLYYGDSKEDSSVMMEKAEKKECLVTLATYAKASEGTNVKAWEVEFLVSSLNNEKNVEQSIGRIRRTKEGKLNPVKVYDVRYSGCYLLRGHYTRRSKVYSRLKFKVKGSSNVPSSPKKGLFTRGYN